MKVLENRTTDSKREMDIFDALTDIRARNARNERMATAGGGALAMIELDEEVDEEEREKLLLEEEDERLVREVFSKQQASTSTLRPPPGTSTDPPSDSEPAMITVKRKAVDDVEPSLLDLLPEATRALIASKKASVPAAATAKRKKPDLKNSLGIKIGVKGKSKAIVK